MPNRPRLHLDGTPLHIVQRGHNREPGFFAEEDYSAYLVYPLPPTREKNLRLKPQKTPP
jgi:hypothetical protein